MINGKKKIVPVMIRPFSNEQTINPFLNPFQNQMLRDTSTVAPPQPNLHLSTLEKDLQSNAGQKPMEIPSEPFASPLSVIIHQGTVSQKPLMQIEAQSLDDKP